MTVSNLTETFSSFGNENQLLGFSKDNLQDKIGTGVDFSKIMVQRTSEHSTSSVDLTESINTNQNKTPVTTESKEKTQNPTELYEKSKNSGAQEKVKTKSSELSEEDVEQIAEKLDTAIDDIRDVLKQQFELTDEELDQALEELGLNILDLQIPSNLTNLLQSLSQEDPIQLLLNPDTLQVMTDVKQEFDTLMRETNLSPELLGDLSKEMSEGDVDLREVLKEMTAIAQEEAIDIADIAIELPTKETQNSEGIQVSESLLQKTPENISNDGTPREEVLPEEEVRDVISFEKKEANGQDENQNPSQNDGDATFSKGTEAVKVEKLDTKSTSFTENISQQVQEVSANPENEAVAQVEEPVPYTSIDTRDLIDQIVTQARVTNTEELHSVEMVLNPEHLGKLHMEVSERDGVVRAKIITENENVKNALLTSLNELKDTFQQQGSKVNEIEISVGAREFRENEERDTSNLSNQMGQNQDGREPEDTASRTGRRSINLNRLDELEGLMTEEERLAASIMRTEGNTMNLKA